MEPDTSLLAGLGLDFFGAGGGIGLAVGVVEDADGRLVELVNFFFDAGGAQV